MSPFRLKMAVNQVHCLYTEVKIWKLSARQASSSPSGRYFMLLSFRFCQSRVACCIQPIVQQEKCSPDSIDLTEHLWMKNF